MRTIWKYMLDLAYQQTIDVPKGFEVCHVEQNPTGGIGVWIAVDTVSEMVPVNFHIVGTGHPLPTFYTRYLGTAVMSDNLVWHVFLG